MELAVLPNGPRSCNGCGECCRNLGVIVMSDDMGPHGVPEEMVDDGMMKQRRDGTCVAFDRKTKRCTIYSRRPLVCQEFERGGHGCRTVSAHLRLFRMSDRQQAKISDYDDC